jgi:putative ABC transport system permease protein
MGTWVAYSLLQLFEFIAPEGIPRLQQAGLDPRVLVFTVAVSLVSGILFGLVPAMRRPSPELLVGKEVGQTSRMFLRQILVAAQVAVSLMLLTGAGLLLHGLWKLQTVPLGMDSQNVVTAQIPLAEYRYPTAQKQVAFFGELERRLRRLPGVTALGISDTLPPSGGSQAMIYSRIEIPGRPKSPEGTGGMVSWRSVTPGYFSALGIAIVEGRGFTDADLGPNEHPVILSQTLARKLFPNEDALNKSFKLGPEAPFQEVIGIAADVRNNGLAEPSDPEYYVPWKVEPEGYFRIGHVTVRTPMNPQLVANWLRQQTAGLDANVPLTIETMSQRVGKLSARPRFNAILLSLFAGMGVVLAAIGIYGVVGFLVAQRTREIGVRMALGASPHSIWKMVMSHVVKWTVAGALVGLLGGWYAVRLLQTLVFHVSLRDPWSIGASLSLLMLAAFAAAWIPARRAMRIEPIEALRYE